MTLLTKIEEMVIDLLTDGWDLDDIQELTNSNLTAEQINDIEMKYDYIQDKYGEPQND